MHTAAWYSNADALRQLRLPRVPVRVLEPAATAALFASAAVVVGVHGAGLANAMMCAPGTALIEIGFGAANEPSTKLHYEHLAAALNLEYRFLPAFAQAEFRASVLELNAAWRQRIVNEVARASNYHYHGAERINNKYQLSLFMYTVRCYVVLL